MTEKRTWLILGGTSAVGRSFARAAAKRGNDIFFLGKAEFRRGEERIMERLLNGPKSVIAAGGSSLTRTSPTRRR